MSVAIAKLNDSQVYLEGGTVTHTNQTFHLSTLQLMTARTPVTEMLLSDLDWILEVEGARPTDQARIDRADITAPLIVYDDPDYGWTVLDGIHRLTKIAAGKPDDPAYTLVPVKVLDTLPNKVDDLIGQGTFLIQTSDSISPEDKEKTLRLSLNALDQMPNRSIQKSLRK